MTDFDDRPGLSLSVDDVVVLCDLIDAEPPSGSRSGLLRLDHPMRDQAEEMIRGSLRARGLLDDHGVHPAVAETLNLAARPNCLVRIVTQRQHQHRSLTAAVNRDVTIVHRELPGRVMRFVPLPTEELASSVYQLTGSSHPARPEPELDADFALPRHSYLELLANANTEHLTPQPARTVEHERFASALRSTSVTSSIMALHEPTPGVLAGGALTWLAAGADCWILPEPSPDGQPIDETLTLRRTTNSGVWDEVRSYFPPDLPIDWMIGTEVA